MASWQVMQMSLAQSLGLARVAETAGDGWLLGPQRLDEEMLERLDVSAVYDEGLLHVLLTPPGTWVSLDRTGAEVSRQQATRPEVMTVQLRASPWWASMRRLLQERGVDPATTVLGDGFDDDEGVDVGVEWDDITDAWRDGPWREAVESALALRASGLARLRSSGRT